MIKPEPIMPWWSIFLIAPAFFIFGIVWTAGEWHWMAVNAALELTGFDPVRVEDQKPRANIGGTIGMILYWFLFRWSAAPRAS